MPEIAKRIALILLPALPAIATSTIGHACTRVLYETGTGTYIVGRSMDWNDPTARTRIWAFPRNMERDGGTGPDAIEWTSRYGSVVASFYDSATADGMNEAGLVGNVLYLAEADFGDAATTDKPTLSVAAWAQYALDNYATVSEAVEGLRAEPFVIVAPVLPNGRAASVHLSLSDPTGDSAIFEYVDGRLIIHHGSDHRVMTNSPIYDQQVAINAYWDLIGGQNMLPGTISAADRYVRASYNLKTSPKFEDRGLAVAAVFSQMRAIGVPLGMSDPDRPNISSTLWRTVADHDAKRYYFESAIKPAVFWVDVDKVDLSPGASPVMVDVSGPMLLAGEISGALEPAEPFEWLAP